MTIIDEILPKVKAEVRLDKANKTLWIKTDTLDGYGRVIIEDGSNWCRVFYEDKTESNSEKPNNCEPQTDCGDFANRLAYERGVKHAWEVAQKVFDSTVTFYEAEDVAKQIDKDINVRSKDEPQTNADQHVQHVGSVEPMQTEREGE